MSDSPESLRRSSSGSLYFTPQKCPECEENEGHIHRSRSLTDPKIRHTATPILRDIPPFQPPNHKSEDQGSTSSRKRSPRHGPVPSKPLPPTPSSERREQFHPPPPDDSFQRKDIEQNPEVDPTKKSERKPNKSQPLQADHHFTPLDLNVDRFKVEVLDKVALQKKLNKKQKFLTAVYITGAIGGVLLVGAGFLAAGVGTVALVAFCPPAGAFVIGGLVLTGSIILMTGGGAFMAAKSIMNLKVSNMMDMWNLGKALKEFDEIQERDGDQFLDFLKSNFENQFNVNYIQDYLKLYKDHQQLAPSEALKAEKAHLEEKREMLRKHQNLEERQHILEEEIKGLQNANAESAEELIALKRTESEIDEQLPKATTPEEKKFLQTRRSEVAGRVEALSKVMEEGTQTIEKNQHELHILDNVLVDIRNNDFDYDKKIEDKIRAIGSVIPPPSVQAEYDQLNRKLEGVTSASLAPSQRPQPPVYKPPKTVDPSYIQQDFHTSVYNKKLNEWRRHALLDSRAYPPLDDFFDITSPGSPFTAIDQNSALKKLDPAKLQNPLIILDSAESNFQENRKQLTQFGWDTSQDFLSNSYRTEIDTPFYRTIVGHKQKCKSVTHYLLSRLTTGDSQFRVEIAKKSPYAALNEYKKKYVGDVPAEGVKKYLPFQTKEKNPYTLVPPNKRNLIINDMQEALFDKFVNPLDGTPNELGKALMATGDRYLIACGEDAIMGVNLNGGKIEGENLLGNMLMSLRSHLRGEPPAALPQQQQQSSGQGQKPPPSEDKEKEKEKD